MTLTRKTPTRVLLVVDVEDAKHIDVHAKSSIWSIVPKIVDYRFLHEKLQEIQMDVIDHSIDFIVYTQNDQVGKRIPIGPVHRKLRLGYSSVSGIDREGSMSLSQTSMTMETLI